MTKQRYTVIGSGPSGANAALTLLQQGKEVVLFDVGKEEQKALYPGYNFQQFKEVLSDPSSFFLGNDYRGILMPSSGSLFDYPPAREFRIKVKEDDWFKIISPSFQPFISHNRGGLGIAWGANTLPYDDDDLKNFLITHADLEPYYQKAAKRMVISGPAEDLLSPSLRDNYTTSPPLRLNTHDQLFLENFFQAWRKKRINDDFLVGRARMAVDNRPDSSHRCTYDDRCLWGCAAEAIYDPRTTLDECQRYPTFEYRPHSFVTHLEAKRGRVTAVHFYHTQERKKERAPVDVVLLAAGTLSSGSIFLRTLKHDADINLPQEHLTTKSLLDTRTVKIPYLFLKMIGRQNSVSDFQFNKLIVAHRLRETEGYPSYIHGEVLSLSSLLYHPLIESLPFGSRSSLKVFPLMKPALGVMTYFLPDRPFGANGLSLTADPDSMTGDRIKLMYEESPEKERVLHRIVETTIKNLRKIGCYASRRKIIYHPSGYGIHYAGTIPMSATRDVKCADRHGRSYAYENLFLADGATFPTLPSKSITFSLMAYAIRVAEAAI